MDKTLQRLISESNYPGTLSGLLIEDVERQKKRAEYLMKTMAKSIDIVKNASAGASDQLKSIGEAAVDWANSNLQELNSLLGGEVEEAAYPAIMQQIDEVSVGLNNFFAAINGGLLVTAKLVLNEKWHEQEDTVDTPINAIMDDAQLQKITADVESGIQSNLIEPPDAGGGIMGWIKKALGAGIPDVKAGPIGPPDMDPDQITEALLGMTPKEIAQSTDSISKAQQGIETTQKEVEQQVEDGQKEAEEDLPDDPSKSGISVKQSELLDQVKDAGEAGQLFIQKLLQNMEALEKAGIKIVEESVNKYSLSRLFEADELKINKDDFQKMYDELASENPDAFAEKPANVLADELNKAVEFLDIEVPEEAEIGPVKEEEVEEAGSELESAAQDAAAESDTPAVAAAKALDSWVDGLNVDIKKGITAGGRIDNLKQVVNSKIEGMADAIEKEVADAVNGWVEQNKPDFPKAFFKKRDKESGELNTTFTETLPTTIAAIAAAMMKKTNESGRYFITKREIHATVHSALNKKYFGNKVITESARWKKLAGII